MPKGPGENSDMVDTKFIFHILIKEVVFIHNSLSSWDVDSILIKGVSSFLMWYTIIGADHNKSYMYTTIHVAKNRFSISAVALYMGFHRNQVLSYMWLLFNSWYMYTYMYMHMHVLYFMYMLMLAVCSTIYPHSIIRLARRMSIILEPVDNHGKCTKL